MLSGNEWLIALLFLVVLAVVVVGVVLVMTTSGARSARRGAGGQVGAGPSPSPGGQVHVAPTDGMATAAMVLGILGLVVCGPLAVVALFLGYSARGRIRQSGGQIGGDGQATAGIVLGWIGVVIWVVLVASMAALVVAGRATG